MKRLALVAAVLVLTACPKKDEGAAIGDTTSTAVSDSAKRADSIRADSIRADSIRKDSIAKADTTKK